jgi:hypothetical protein
MKYPLFNIHDNDDIIEYTPEAMAFEETIDAIVESGEINHENCKEALKQIFIIQ